MSLTGVVLGHARSGSSELSRAIRDATGVRLTMEPFHRPMRKAGVTFESPEFSAYLDRVLDEARLIKHMWNGLTLEQNAAVLLHPSISGVVFIYRENVLRSALSNAVAQMTGTWLGSAQKIPSPLPLDKIEQQQCLFLEGQKIYVEYLRRSSINHVIMKYEDVFVENAEQRTQHLRTACETLGIPALDYFNAIGRLAPDKRYNSDELYSSAPNWGEFVERFGEL